MILGRGSLAGLLLAATTPLLIAACLGLGGSAAKKGELATARTGTASAGPSTAPSPTPVAPQPLRGKVIALDPGHNGLNHRHPEIVNRKVDAITKWKPCDAVGTRSRSGYTEAAFNFDLARRLYRLLRAKGATVISTRKNNRGVGPCITERAAIGNRTKAHAALSIHADGAPPRGTGFHVILPAKIGGPVDAVLGPSHQLGRDIRDAVRGIGLPYSNYAGRDGLDVRSDLGGLNWSRVPKVFIECGNLRNPNEARMLEDPRFRQRLAEALAAGLERFVLRG